ncbi:N-acetyltransferase [Motilibacter aurantiacus]|uniref:N-acetyltransferase n=1 Tax=Motilibacter aurantiacus TaxID=2714955 RepID=UPI00140DEE09|nr:N-acetyltransferase [Motilibacter aurantiacus]NHC47176.1 N-acetyltransferase [Motilibacter aurantiacus]
MRLQTYRLSERPDLAQRFGDLDGAWPAFMDADPTADLYYGHLDRYADYVLVAVDADDPGRLLGRACSIPMTGSHDALPDGGWGAAIRRGTRDRLAGRTPDLVSALEVTLRPDAQGLGLSGRMVQALRANTRALGFDALVVPVRPNHKHLEPHVPMEEYAARTRADGLPEDPWLRVHARQGATIEGVAPLSMAVPGTLEQWRGWTGLPFDTSGPVVVPGALAPVQADLAQGVAVYVEPNVWMRHDLG